MGGRLFKFTILASVLSAIVLLYQNCGSSSGFDFKSMSSAASGGGNGHGYGGKPYVATRTSGLCSDGSAVELRILVTDEATGTALLTRENCADLFTPRSIKVRVLLSGTTISYAGRTLVAEEPSIVNPTLTGTVASPSPSPAPAGTCAATSGQSCTFQRTETTYTSGCPQDYICAKYVGVWYGSTTGCDRSGESCSTQQSPYPTGSYDSCTRPAFPSQHVSYVGKRCTYIGNGTTDPFGGVADGQCRAATNYPIASTFTQVVPDTGCMEVSTPTTVDVPGTIGCDGICR